MASADVGTPVTSQPELMDETHETDDVEIKGKIDASSIIPPQKADQDNLPPTPPIEEEHPISASEGAISPTTDTLETTTSQLVRPSSPISADTERHNADGLSTLPPGATDPLNVATEEAGDVITETPPSSATDTPNSSPEEEPEFSTEAEVEASLNEGSREKVLPKSEGNNSPTFPEVKASEIVGDKDTVSTTDGDEIISTGETESAPVAEPDAAAPSADSLRCVLAEENSVITTEQGTKVENESLTTHDIPETKTEETVNRIDTSEDAASKSHIETPNLDGNSPVTTDDPAREETEEALSRAATASEGQDKTLPEAQDVTVTKVFTPEMATSQDEVDAPIGETSTTDVAQEQLDLSNVTLETAPVEEIKHEVADATSENISSLELPKEELHVIRYETETQGPEINKQTEVVPDRLTETEPHAVQPDTQEEQVVEETGNQPPPIAEPESEIEQSQIHSPGPSQDEHSVPVETFLPVVGSSQETSAAVVTEGQSKEEQVADVPDIEEENKNDSGVDALTNAATQEENIEKKVFAEAETERKDEIEVNTSDIVPEESTSDDGLQAVVNPELEAKEGTVSVAEQSKIAADVDSLTNDGFPEVTRTEDVTLSGDIPTVVEVQAEVESIDNPEVNTPPSSISQEKTIAVTESELEMESNQESEPNASLNEEISKEDAPTAAEASVDGSRELAVGDRPDADKLASSEDAPKEEVTTLAQPGVEPKEKSVDSTLVAEGSKESQSDAPAVVEVDAAKEELKKDDFNENPGEISASSEHSSAEKLPKEEEVSRVPVVELIVVPPTTEDEMQSQDMSRTSLSVAPQVPNYGVEDTPSDEKVNLTDGEQKVEELFQSAHSEASETSISTLQEPKATESSNCETISDDIVQPSVADGEVKGEEAPPIFSESGEIVAPDHADVGNVVEPNSVKLEPEHDTKPESESLVLGVEAQEQVANEEHKPDEEAAVSQEPAAVDQSPDFELPVTSDQRVETKEPRTAVVEAESEDNHTTRYAAATPTDSEAAQGSTIDFQTSNNGTQPYPFEDKTKVQDQLEIEAFPQINEGAVLEPEASQDPVSDDNLANDDSTHSGASKSIPEVVVESTVNTDPAGELPHITETQLPLHDEPEAKISTQQTEDEEIARLQGPLDQGIEEAIATAPVEVSVTSDLNLQVEHVEAPAETSTTVEAYKDPEVAVRDLDTPNTQPEDSTSTPTAQELGKAAETSEIISEAPLDLPLEVPQAPVTAQGPHEVSITEPFAEPTEEVTEVESLSNLEVLEKGETPAVDKSEITVALAQPVVDEPVDVADNLVEALKQEESVFVPEVSINSAKEMKENAPSSEPDELNPSEVSFIVETYKATGEPEPETEVTLEPGVPQAAKVEHSKIQTLSEPSEEIKGTEQPEVLSEDEVPVVEAEVKKPVVEASTDASTEAAAVESPGEVKETEQSKALLEDDIPVVGAEVQEPEVESSIDAPTEAAAVVPSEEIKEIEQPEALLDNNVPVEAEVQEVVVEASTDAPTEVAAVEPSEEIKETEQSEALLEDEVPVVEEVRVVQEMPVVQEVRVVEEMPVYEEVPVVEVEVQEYVVEASTDTPIEVAAVEPSEEIKETKQPKDEVSVVEEVPVVEAEVPELVVEASIDVPTEAAEQVDKAKGDAEQLDIDTVAETLAADVQDEQYKTSVTDLVVEGVGEPAPLISGADDVQNDVSAKLEGNQTSQEPAVEETSQKAQETAETDREVVSHLPKGLLEVHETFVEESSVNKVDEPVGIEDSKEKFVDTSIEEAEAQDSQNNTTKAPVELSEVPQQPTEIPEAIESVEVDDLTKEAGEVTEEAPVQESEKGTTETPAEVSEVPQQPAETPEVVESVEVDDLTKEAGEVVEEAPVQESDKGTEPPFELSEVPQQPAETPEVIESVEVDDLTKEAGEVVEEASVQESEKGTTEAPVEVSEVPQQPAETPEVMESMEAHESTVESVVTEGSPEALASGWAAQELVEEQPASEIVTHLPLEGAIETLQEDIVEPIAQEPSGTEALLQPVPEGLVSESTTEHAAEQHKSQSTVDLPEVEDIRGVEEGHPDPIVADPISLDAAPEVVQQLSVEEHRAIMEEPAGQYILEISEVSSGAADEPKEYSEQKSEQHAEQSVVLPAAETVGGGAEEVPLAALAQVAKEELPTPQYSQQALEAFESVVAPELKSETHISPGERSEFPESDSIRDLKFQDHEQIKSIAEFPSVETAVPSDGPSGEPTITAIEFPVDSTPETPATTLAEEHTNEELISKDIPEISKVINQTEHEVPSDSQIDEVAKNPGSIEPAESSALGEAAGEHVGTSSTDVIPQVNMDHSENKEESHISVPEGESQSSPKESFAPEPAENETNAFNNQQARGVPPFELAVIDSHIPERETGEEEQNIPEIVVELTPENQPSHRDDAQPEGTITQKDAFVAHQADTVPDQVIMMSQEPKSLAGAGEETERDEDLLVINREDAIPEDGESIALTQPLTDGPNDFEDNVTIVGNSATRGLISGLPETVAERAEIAAVIHASREGPAEELPKSATPLPATTAELTEISHSLDNIEQEKQFHDEDLDVNDIEKSVSTSPEITRDLIEGAFTTVAPDSSEQLKSATPLPEIVATAVEVADTAAISDKEQEFTIDGVTKDSISLSEIGKTTAEVPDPAAGPDSSRPETESTETPKESSQFPHFSAKVGAGAGAVALAVTATAVALAAREGELLPDIPKSATPFFETKATNDGALTSAAIDNTGEKKPQTNNAPSKKDESNESLEEIATQTIETKPVESQFTHTHSKVGSIDVGYAGFVEPLQQPKESALGSVEEQIEPKSTMTTSTKFHVPGSFDDVPSEATLVEPSVPSNELLGHEPRKDVDRALKDQITDNENLHHDEIPEEAIPEPGPDHSKGKGREDPGAVKVTENIFEAHAALLSPSDHQMLANAPSEYTDSLISVDKISEALRYMRDNESTPMIASSRVVPPIIVTEVEGEESDDGFKPRQIVEVITPDPAEATGELRKRKDTDSKLEQSRPTTRGSDHLSTKHHRNLLQNFWNMIIISWLGNFGRFFVGLFGRKNGVATQLAESGSRVNLINDQQKQQHNQKEKGKEKEKDNDTKQQSFGRSFSKRLKRKKNTVKEKLKGG